MQVPEKMKRETMCWREREQNLKTKGALLESHCMYSYGSELELTLGICVRDIIIL